MPRKEQEAGLADLAQSEPEEEPVASTSCSERDQAEEGSQDRSFASQPAPDATGTKSARKTRRLQALQQGFRKRGAALPARAGQKVL